MTNSLVNIMVVMFDGGKVSAEIIVSIEHSSRVCFILAVIAAFVLTMLQSGDKDMSKMHLKYLCVCVCVCVWVWVWVWVLYMCVLHRYALIRTCMGMKNCYYYIYIFKGLNLLVDILSRE